MTAKKAGEVRELQVTAAQGIDESRGFSLPVSSKEEAEILKRKAAPEAKKPLDASLSLYVESGK